MTGEQLREIAATEVAVIDAAIDLVALWDSPRIAELSRAERNVAIAGARTRLTVSVHKLQAARVKWSTPQKRA